VRTAPNARSPRRSSTRSTCPRSSAATGGVTTRRRGCG
jgi:hypothetical protein